MGMLVEATENVDKELKRKCKSFIDKAGILGDYINITIEEKDCVLTKYTTSNRKIKIPPFITLIDAFAFNKCENLTNLELSDGLRWIFPKTLELNASELTINIPRTYELMPSLNNLAKCTIRLDGQHTLETGTLYNIANLQIINSQNIKSIKGSAVTGCTITSDLYLKTSTIKGLAFKECRFADVHMEYSSTAISLITKSTLKDIHIYISERYKPELIEMAEYLYQLEKICKTNKMNITKDIEEMAEDEKVHLGVRYYVSENLLNRTRYNKVYVHNIKDFPKPTP